MLNFLSFFRAGHLNYEIALNLSKILREDFNYISWKSAFDGFAYIGKMLGRSNTSEFYSVRYYYQYIDVST